jgi:hypothetical protein
MQIVLTEAGKNEFKDDASNYLKTWPFIHCSKVDTDHHFYLIVEANHDPTGEFDQLYVPHHLVKYIAPRPNSGCDIGFQARAQQEMK